MSNPTKQPWWSTMPRERRDLLAWLSIETQKYADPKFGPTDDRPTHDEDMARDGIGESGWWYNQIFQYVRRAQLFGVDTPKGRQAMAKCFACLGGFLESMQRVHGPLPEPGHPSGEIEPWA